MSVHPFIYTSVSPSIFAPICMSVSLSISLPIYPYFPLFVSQSFCFPVCLSVCLSVYLSACLSIFLSVRLSVCGKHSFEDQTWMASSSRSMVVGGETPSNAFKVPAEYSSQRSILHISCRRERNKLERLQGILKGKYHCTIDLLFDWFGLVCFANKNQNCQWS
jgi:hypothetical protein